MEESVYSFLKNRKQKICVLATVSEKNLPEAAVVGYAVTERLHLFISTEETSRKLTNLTKNPHVAVVIGWGFDEINVQYEGNVRLIYPAMTDLYNDAQAFFYEMNPGAKAFQTPSTIFIEVTPSWIRLLDVTKTPPHTQEKKY